MNGVFLRQDQVIQYYPGAEVSYHNSSIEVREGKLYTETWYVVPTPKLRRVIAIIKALAITVFTFTVILWFEKTRRAFWNVPDMYEKNGLCVLSPYSESDSFKTLCKEVLRGAVLKNDPLVKKYPANITIYNHTENEIIFEKNEQFYLNGKSLAYFHLKDTQLIAYSLEGFPEIICMEQKSLFSLEAGKRLVMKVSPKFRFTNMLATVADFLPKISERLYQRKVFTRLLMGCSDENSFFYKNGIVSDIFLLIIEQYGKLIENAKTKNNYELLGEGLFDFGGMDGIDLCERYGIRPFYLARYLK